MLVVFDCNDVLLETPKIGISGEVAFFGKNGIKISYEDMRNRFLGASDVDAFAELE